MAQLKMFCLIEEIEYPKAFDDFSYRRFSGSEEDIAAWLEICKNGLAAPDAGRERFESAMLGREGYKYSDTFFIMKNEAPVATITAIVYDDKKLGYVHMVAAKPEVRGRGIGDYMNKIAKAEFYKRGCTGAHLTTDEFRVPAIKSYLKAGFKPVEYDEGMEDRWIKWLSENGYKNIDFVDENGAFIKKLLA